MPLLERQFCPDGGRRPDFYGFTIDGVQKEDVLVYTLRLKTTIGYLHSLTNEL